MAENGGRHMQGAECGVCNVTYKNINRPNFEGFQGSIRTLIIRVSDYLEGFGLWTVELHWNEECFFYLVYPH